MDILALRWYSNIDLTKDKICAYEIDICFIRNKFKNYIISTVVLKSLLCRKKTVGKSFIFKWLLYYFELFVAHALGVWIDKNTKIDCKGVALLYRFPGKAWKWANKICIRVERPLFRSFTYVHPPHDKFSRPVITFYCDCITYYVYFICAFVGWYIHIYVHTHIIYVYINFFQVGLFYNDNQRFPSILSTFMFWNCVYFVEGDLCIYCSRYLGRSIKANTLCV